MKNPPVPKDEKLRLETLQSLNVLDTPHEERFDQLTRMAKRLFDVPIALVSLIDENRQWFKSCVGLDAKETSRDISFCGHAILGDEVFIVPNTLEDSRFADNPLVLNDPSIRFYAGCPLNVNGYKLGTLCIIDRVPRAFGKDDIDALKDLAGMAERELAAIQLATVDELTNISNRRGFLLLAQYSLKLCVREKVPAILAFLDLNKFKAINDEFGHAEGDLALQAFSTQMQLTLRESDLFARLGGDEFVLLFTSASKQQAEESLRKCSDSLEAYNRAANRGYDISFAYGIAQFDPHKPTTVEELLAEGDALMLEIKQARI